MRTVSQGSSFFRQSSVLTSSFQPCRKASVNIIYITLKQARGDATDRDREAKQESFYTSAERGRPHRLGSAEREHVNLLRLLVFLRDRWLKHAVNFNL